MDVGWKRSWTSLKIGQQRAGGFGRETGVWQVAFGYIVDVGKSWVFGSEEEAWLEKPWEDTRTPLGDTGGTGVSVPGEPKRTTMGVAPLWPRWGRSQVRVKE